ncbi:magnesium transporter [Rhodobacteraceae bacterium RKSG542]|uniref:magnesium transporter n=1 Tax=Pseudovibrio flavus TaxID=2529854 RepID=UPI0012BC3494|nr:magnesium transporter [Pseudovibrio flavus]MTI16301.1 magnesium transporter [Pseudovibrio flavus]
MKTNTTLPALHWNRASNEKATAHNEAVQRQILEMLAENKTDGLVTELRNWDPTDLLQLLTQMPLVSARKLLKRLPINPSAKIMAELDPDFRALLLHDETLSRLTDMLNEMSEDDVVETLDEFPPSVVELLTPKLNVRKELEERLLHDEDTAGRLMTRKFVVFKEDNTAREAIDSIRDQSELLGRFRTIFVVDNEGHLVGRMDVTKLLTIRRAERIGDHMSRTVLAVSSDMDQEDVLRKAAQLELSAVPVVDAEGRLIGRISIEQLNQIAREEAVEDMMLMGGVSPEARPDDSIRRIIKGRLPWLMSGLVGSAVAATVVGSYEDELAKAAILAAFIPVIMSMAGNSGLQASAVAVQGLATGSIWANSTLFRLWKEFCGAVCNGAIAGCVLSALIMVASFVFEIHQPAHLAVTASLALLTATTIAAMVGATIPLLLDKVGIDPAAATGVFITTSNDVLGVLIYFTIASALYL